MSTAPTRRTHQGIPHPAKQVPDPRALCVLAEKALLEREQEANLANTSAEAKEACLATELQAAIDAFEGDASEEHGGVLQRAIMDAQKAAVASHLRVRARKLLARQVAPNRRAELAEAELKRLISQVTAMSEAMKSREDTPQLTNETSTTSQTDALHRQRFRRRDAVKNELRLALGEAELAGVSQQVRHEARLVLTRLEKEQHAKELAEQRLMQLRRQGCGDASELEDRLFLERGRLEAGMSPGTKRISGEIESRVAKLSAAEQRERWLKDEFEAAAKDSDVIRLQQLVLQAKSMNATVPPQMLAALHELEAKEQGTPMDHAKSRDHLTKLEIIMQRLKEAAEAAVTLAIEKPSLEAFDKAKHAIADARSRRVKEEDVHTLERRLALAEAKNSQRLEVAAELDLFVRTNACANGVRGQALIKDANRREQLRALIRRATDAGVDEELVRNARDLLEPSRTRVGAATSLAEKELEERRAAQLQREAAECELREAAKCTGHDGQQKLEEAIKAARGAGASDKELRLAAARLSELEKHKRRCGLMIGNIRRAVHLLPKDPWRFQLLLDSAKEIPDWTPELTRVVQESREQVDKALQEEVRQHEVQHRLKLCLARLRKGRGPGQAVGSEDLAALIETIAEARELHLPQEMVAEAEGQLRDLRRDGYRRVVAEHKLRLAMNAKDFPGIERSVREIRALGQSGLLDGTTPINSARSTRSSSAGPQSARLMDAASSMMRQLGDAVAQRQAATAALMERLSDIDAVPPSFAGTGPDDQTHATEALEHVVPEHSAAKCPEDLGLWIQEFAALLQEAKQCGVAPSLLEHARLKLREKRREHQDQLQAYDALQRALAKKGAPQQELLRHLRKVQRLHAVR